MIDMYPLHWASACRLRSKPAGLGYTGSKEVFCDFVRLKVLGVA